MNTYFHTRTHITYVYIYVRAHICLYIRVSHARTAYIIHTYTPVDFQIRVRFEALVHTHSPSHLTPTLTHFVRGAIFTNCTLSFVLCSYILCPLHIWLAE